MRDIKYRGKNHNKEWIYGDLITYESGNRSIRRVLDWFTQNIIPETVGQYINLKDKKTVEIYEDDIVRDVHGKIAYVAFLQQEMGYVLVYPKYDRKLGHRNTNSGYECDTDIEVIGNRHDNPELLSV